MIFKITRATINDFFISDQSVDYFLPCYLDWSINQSQLPPSKRKDIQLTVIEGKIEVSEFLEFLLEKYFKIKIVADSFSVNYK